MTHVFVAPHPDDVALSCGGLIASLRELGQNVTILTVFSGNGASDRLTPYQREALGLRLEGAVAIDRGVQPRRHPARLPDLAGVAGRRGGARGDAGRGRRRRQALLAALVVVSPGEHPRRVARGPAGHRRPADPGRRPDRGGHRCRRGRRPDGPTAARGRALRLLRRGVDRVPRPARRGLPRLRGRRAAARHARGRTTRRRSTSCARRSPGSSRRRSTCRSASAGTSTTSCAATSASRCSTRAGAGSCPGRSTPARSSSTRTSRTRGGAPSTASRTSAPASSTRSPSARQYLPDVRRHRRPDRAQDHGHRHLPEPDRAPLRQHARRWPMRCARTARRPGSPAGWTGRPNGTG